MTDFDRWDLKVLEEELRKLCPPKPPKSEVQQILDDLKHKWKPIGNIRAGCLAEGRLVRIGERRIPRN